MAYFRQRETLTYIWFVSLAILLLLSAVMTWRYTIPTAPRIHVGNRAEFTTGAPRLHHLSATLAVYIVNLDGQFYAWDTEAAVPQPCAQIHWHAGFNRFEDSCSGAKWCADGTIADGRIPQTRTLTRYPLEISAAGDLYLLPWRKQQGDPSPALWHEPHAIDWMPPTELYTCQHLPAS